MSIIKTVNESNDLSYDTEESVYGLIYYIFDICKTSCDDIRVGNVIGDFVGCSHFMGSYEQSIDPELVALQMIINNNAYGKGKGNLLKHRIISFDNNDCVLPGEALQLARYIAEAYGENYITAYGVHLDSGNIHIHLAIDTISWRDGLRFSISHEFKWLNAMASAWMTRRFEEQMRNPQWKSQCEKYYGF